MGAWSRPTSRPKQDRKPKSNSELPSMWYHATRTELSREEGVDDRCQILHMG